MSNRLQKFTAAAALTTIGFMGNSALAQQAPANDLTIDEQPLTTSIMDKINEAEQVDITVLMEGICARLEADIVSSASSVGVTGLVFKAEDIDDFGIHCDGYRDGAQHPNFLHLIRAKAQAVVRDQQTLDDFENMVVDIVRLGLSDEDRKNLRQLSGTLPPLMQKLLESIELREQVDVTISVNRICDRLNDEFLSDARAADINWFRAEVVGDGTQISCKFYRDQSLVGGPSGPVDLLLDLRYLDALLVVRGDQSIGDLYEDFIVELITSSPMTPSEKGQLMEMYR